MLDIYPGLQDLADDRAVIIYVEDCVDGLRPDAGRNRADLDQHPGSASVTRALDQSESDDIP
jgi:hypothetical protein